MSGRHVVARAADLADGERMIVEVGGRSIGIFNVGGEYYGLLNRCPHQGAEMCKGQIGGTVSSSVPGEYHYDAGRKLLMCPWHGWEFDIRTGQSYIDPTGTRLRAFGIDVEPGAKLVEGPFVAETIDVSVEDDYLVVNLRPRRSK
ncbi:MAG: Rieske (2Fe-2S) protein [Solirubrobacterales bacterium]|nr:Rieske (2Fe-2S) protein [Solirubrobacterales bacterium]